MHEFVSSFPCNASELVHFRKRLGEKGIELILTESIRMNDDRSDEDHHDTAFIDSTVQEKNVIYPTDSKLHKKIIGKVLKIAKELNLPIRQSYTFVLKGIYRDQRFRNHPKNRKKSIKADKRLRTIEKSLGQVFRMTGKGIKQLAGDRGYRGKKEISGTQILIPDSPQAKDTYYQRKKKHKLFCKRAGIEPTIGDLKTDYRLGKNFYKGLLGDAINVMLAAAAYKRAMRVLWGLIQRWMVDMKIFTIRWENNI